MKITNARSNSSTTRHLLSLVFISSCYCARCTNARFRLVFDVLAIELIAVIIAMPNGYD